MKNKDKTIEQNKNEPKEPVLEFINFSKKYSMRANYAVKDASFKVFPGEFHGFIGANGAGKTTTIKSLIGAYGSYEGNIKIFGDSNKKEEIKKRIGYIPESANFPIRMKTWKYLAYMSYLSGLSYAEAKKFANDSIKRLKMERFRNRCPNTFSSGQKKKILLAQSLINDPDLLIMDEPAANLDPKAREEFFSSLKSLQSEGKSVFISSHILDELDRYVDSATILDGGKIVFSGKMDQIQNRIKEFTIKLSNDEDIKKLKVLLKESKIKFNLNLSDEFIIFPKNENTFALVSKLLIKSKIPFEKISKNKMSLSFIYHKFVKKGSAENFNKGVLNG